MADRFRDDPEGQKAVAALPFVDRIEGNDVYFKPITMADYTVRGIYVSMYSGVLFQTWQEVDNAPHPHVMGEEDCVSDEYDGSLCANTDDIARALGRGNWIDAVTAALCIAATHTYEDAPQYIPEAISCELCGKSGSRGIHDLNITYFRHLHKTIYCHFMCYDELYNKLRGDDSDDTPF